MSLNINDEVSLKAVYQFINDVIEETNDQENFILNVSKEQTDNIISSSKPIFGIILFSASLVASFIPSQILEVTDGINLIFLNSD